MKTSEYTKEKRQELKGISNTLRQAKEKGEIKTINEGLAQIYASQGHEQLKTYAQWLAEGKQVKRNAKALYLWSRQKEKTIDENGQPHTFTYFPLLAVFSSSQVYDLKNN